MGILFPLPSTALVIVTRLFVWAFTNVPNGAQKGSQE